MREDTNNLKLEQLKNGSWIHAPDVPESKEGSLMWMWTEGMAWPEIERIVPFSREPQHCSGYYYHEIDFPETPVNGGLDDWKGI